MGLSCSSKLDIIVYVDPVVYYNMPYSEKNSVAKMIGKINWTYRNSGKHMMLMVPGIQTDLIGAAVIVATYFLQRRRASKRLAA